MDAFKLLQYTIIASLPCIPPTLLYPEEKLCKLGLATVMPVIIAAVTPRTSSVSIMYLIFTNIHILYYQCEDYNILQLLLSILSRLSNCDPNLSVFALLLSGLTHFSFM